MYAFVVHYYPERGRSREPLLSSETYKTVAKAEGAGKRFVRLASTDYVLVVKLEPLVKMSMGEPIRTVLAKGE